MSRYRYSEWDGSQDILAPDADELVDELVDELGRNLMYHGDMSSWAQRWMRYASS